MFGVLLAATIAVPQASATANTTANTTPKAAPRHASAIPAGAFGSVMQNGSTGKCADLPNYGSVPPNTQVTQFTCNLSNSADNQVWNFIPTSTFQGVTFYDIVNAKSGLCLDLPNYGSDPSGTPVSVYPCAANPDADNQQWMLEPTGTLNGTTLYQVVNEASNGLCLDVANWARDGSDLANGLPLSIYTCLNPAWGGGGYDDHLWFFPGYDA